MSNILIKPIVTEKSTKLGEKFNRYAFRVDKDANRLQIKKAVETAYLSLIHISEPTRPY